MHLISIVAEIQTEMRMGVRGGQEQEILTGNHKGMQTGCDSLTIQGTAPGTT